MTATRLIRQSHRTASRGGWWRSRICAVVALIASATGEYGHAAPACPETRQPYASYGFLGFACRDRDCATHKAGFAWADRAGVASSAACAEAGVPGSGDPGFIEGCRAFVEEVVTAEQSGFEWARENEVTEQCRCAGAGPGFQAGCAAYVAGFGD